MTKINGFLMHKDSTVAEIRDNNVIIVNDALLPLYLQRGGALENWLANRAIDRHRPHSRLLKRMLRLTGASDEEVALRVNAATITDNWWIKGLDQENLTYDKVRFSVNYFDNLALIGDPDSIARANRQEILSSRSPELTNTGSFEKCWKLEGGNWWLYKLSDEGQSFSELFICEVGSAMSFDMVCYEKWERGTKSIDFTKNAAYDFEPAFGLVSDDVDYLKNYEAISRLKPSFCGAYLDLLASDALFFNFDRHTHNYGFLRDANTGEFLRMAPNFDNNLALIANGYPTEKSLKRKNDLFINDFFDLLSQTGVSYEMPRLTEIMLERAFASIDTVVDEDIIKKFVCNGYERLITKLPVRG